MARTVRKSNSDKEVRRIAIKPVTRRPQARGTEEPEEPSSLLWVPPTFRDKDKKSDEVASKGSWRNMSAPVPEGMPPLPAAGTGAPPQVRSRRASPKEPSQAASATPRGVLIALAGFASLLVTAVAFYILGASHERAASAAVAAPAAKAPEAEVTAAQESLVEEALKQIGRGETKAALKTLEQLRAQNASVRSLHYITSLAALQAGDAHRASAEAEASIAKCERVSDSLAIRAAVEGLKPSAAGWQPAGDKRSQAAAYLREAIKADPANPHPFVELAIRARGQGKDDEAAALFESARLRMPPIDTRAVLETTLVLIRLQKLPDQELPRDIDPDKDEASLVGAAYVAMRLGDFGSAAALLRTAGDRLPVDLYRYLLGDPVFKDFARRDDLAPFFR